MFNSITSLCVLFQPRKLVDILKTWHRGCSLKWCLTFLFVCLFLGYRRAAESPVAPANYPPAADIDRRGQRSLQEANNKAKVKIHPVKKPVQLLLFIQGGAPSDLECPWKNKNPWIWLNVTYNSRPFSGCCATCQYTCVFVNVHVLSTGWIFHLPSNRHHLRSSTRRRDAGTSLLSPLHGTSGPSFKKLCVSNSGSLWSARCGRTTCVEETQSLEWEKKTAMVVSVCSSLTAP